jgi:hypothetical protein
MGENDALMGQPKYATRHIYVESERQARLAAQVNPSAVRYKTLSPENLTQQSTAAFSTL